jgi:hypothetical protein
MSREAKCACSPDVTECATFSERSVQSLCLGTSSLDGHQVTRKEMLELGSSRFTV